MSNLYDDASLIMYPSGYKEDKIYSLKPTDGSGDLDFTRASSATRVNAEGLIEDVEIILPTELIVNSDFENGSTGWSLVGDFAISGGKASITSASQYSQLTSQGTNFLTSGNQYKLQVDIETLSISGVFAYRFSGGAVTPILTSQIVNGKFEANFTMPTNGYLWFQTTGSYTGLNVTIDNVSVKEVITNNVPRIDYTGGGCGKLLLEPQRTNSLLQSNTFNTAWINQLGGGTITGGQINPLSASDDAWKLTKDAASGRSIRQAISLSSSTYSYSAFLKSGTLANAAMRVDTSSGARFMNLDLSIGTISSTSGTIVSTSIEDYGNGWYRCTMVVAESITNVHVYVGEFSGTIAGDIYCQRTQLEAGSYPTSYIPTLGTAVTRVADSASKSGISSLINSEEGSFYVEAKALFNGGTFRSFSLTDGTEPNRITFNWSSNASVFLLFVKLGGTLIVNNSTSAFAQTDNNKILLKWGGGTYKLFINGVLKTTLTGLAMPSASLFNRLTFDASYTPFEGRVQGVMIFPTQVSDTDAIALTTL